MEDHMVPHTAIDHTPLTADEDMILPIIGIIDRILDPALLIGHLLGDVTGRTHLMTIIPLILTTEGTGIGQFLGVFHQRPGFLADVILAVILQGLGEEP